MTQGRLFWVTDRMPGQGDRQTYWMERYNYITRIRRTILYFQILVVRSSGDSATIEDRD